MVPDQDFCRGNSTSVCCDHSLELPHVNEAVLISGHNTSFYREFPKQKCLNSSLSGCLVIYVIDREILIWRNTMSSRTVK